MTKKLILFDSNHQSPLKQSKSTNKFHSEDYEIEQDNNIKKDKKPMDKASEMSNKNTSRYAGSKMKGSGIKLVSKNQHKRFDTLYKNDYGNDIFK